MESDLKPILSAILDRLEIQSARFEAFQREITADLREFKAEMNAFRTETNEKLDNLTHQQDYFAGRLGHHDRDLLRIRLKVLT